MKKPLDFLYSELKVTFRLLKESLSKGLAYFLSFSLFLLLGSIGFSFLGFFGQRIDQVRATSLELENRVLAGKLLDLEFFQTELDKEIKELGQMEQKVRGLLGLRVRGAKGGKGRNPGCFGGLWVLSRRKDSGYRSIGRRGKGRKKGVRVYLPEAKPEKRFPGPHPFGLSGRRLYQPGLRNRA